MEKHQAQKGKNYKSCVWFWVVLTIHLPRERLPWEHLYACRGPSHTYLVPPPPPSVALRPLSFALSKREREREREISERSSREKKEKRRDERSPTRERNSKSKLHRSFSIIAHRPKTTHKNKGKYNVKHPARRHQISLSLYITHTHTQNSSFFAFVFCISSLLEKVRYGVEHRNSTGHVLQTSMCRRFGNDREAGSRRISCR